MTHDDVMEITTDSTDDTGIIDNDDVTNSSETFNDTNTVTSQPDDRHDDMTNDERTTDDSSSVNAEHGDMPIDANDADKNGDDDCSDEQNGTDSSTDNMPNVDGTHLPRIDDAVEHKTDSDDANVPLLDMASNPIISLRDDVHSEYADIARSSRFPKAARIAIGAICVIACFAALVTVMISFAIVEIHPSVAGGVTVASEVKKGIDGSGNKITVSYNVKDALHSFSTDDAEILVWSDSWYSVANGTDGEQAKAALAAAGKGSTVNLSDGTVISVDGRYGCKASGAAAGIDIDAIKKLYGDATDWVAIRYDSSHVLVGKRVAGGENTSAGNQ